MSARPDGGRAGVAAQNKALRKAVAEFLRAWDHPDDDPAGVNLSIRRMRAALSLETDDA